VTESSVRPAITPPASAQARPGRTPGRLAAALSGAVAAAVSIAISELVAGLVAGAPSLVVAIGTLVIDLQPAGAKDFVVNLFGTNDKLALNVAVVVAALVVAAGLGVAARRQIHRADLGFGAFGLITLVAAGRQPLVSFPLAVVTAVVAVGGGLAVLRYLLFATGTSPDALAGVSDPAVMPDWDRRRFLLRGATVAGAAVVAGGVGRYLLERRAGTRPAVSTVLPHPTNAVAPLSPAQSLNVAGITPIVVQNSRFYRIDTALIAPHVDADTWRLTVNGMVEHPVTMSYADLAQLPLVEQYVTIACVSNRVGGDLVGNALWAGVRLRDVLDMSGVRPGATQIVGRSADGWTAGFPTEYAMDRSREPMIALLMNGEPLPIEHGYPARLIVPGLYGYVSATKWLTEIELTTLEAFDGYWIPLGWAKNGPILTQSRIDVPRDGDSLQAGRTTVAGVAWAPDRGVSKVEVSVDDGDWIACAISEPISDATWVQWQVPLTLAAGRHRIAVRATDGDGMVQTAELSEPAPDGARGHHTIEMSING
jgi:DMSO/TMAO reductase YedYZ molybdopterin-dependent catalytic subunit